MFGDGCMCLGTGVGVWGTGDGCACLGTGIGVWGRMQVFEDGCAC